MPFTSGPAGLEGKTMVIDVIPMAHGLVLPVSVGK
jgi:hypothetical protein